ncbi:MAG: PRC-barrel domain-containing protein [Ruminococcus sp.]
MICSLTELKDKDVINICNGENLGYADDIRLDTRTAAVTGLILYGKPRFFGIFGAREKSIITYDQIRLIGKDVILVSLEKSVNMFNIDKTQV